MTVFLHRLQHEAWLGFGPGFSLLDFLATGAAGAPGEGAVATVAASRKASFGDVTRVRTGKYLFTSESVAEGHPDKICDRISDAIVDTFLTHDPHSRVAVETLSTTNRIVLAGEVRGPAEVNAEMIEQVARHAIKEIGYEQDGFHWERLTLENHIHPQSPDIAQGVDAKGNKDEGAGDQGIMFGYACLRPKSTCPRPSISPITS